MQREEVAFHIRIEVISPFTGRFGNAIVYHAVAEPREIGPTNLKKGDDNMRPNRKRSRGLSPLMVRSLECWRSADGDDDCAGEWYRCSGLPGGLQSVGRLDLSQSSGRLWQEPWH